MIDDLSTGKRENLESAIANGAELIELDVRDAEAVAAAVERVGPEVIFHLAAQIDVRKSVADPAYDSRVNVEGTINVLGAAQAGGVRPAGQHLHRRRDLRRGPDPPRPRGPPGRARVALRPVQVLRRELLRAVHPPARAVDGLAALRQRLRPAPGPARRGRRDRDLLRQAARWRAAEDLRRRQADARLRLRGRRRGRQPAGRRLGRHRRLQRRPRRRRPACSTSSRRSPRSRSNGFEADHAPARTGEVQHIALDPSRTKAELGWEAQVDLDQGLARTLDSLR